MPYFSVAWQQRDGRASPEVRVHVNEFVDGRGGGEVNLEKRPRIAAFEWQLATRPLGRKYLAGAHACQEQHHATLAAAGHGRAIVAYIKAAESLLPPNLRSPIAPGPFRSPNHHNRC